MKDSSPQPRTPSEEIAGLVERVTFFNEESGFAVLRVKVRGQRELVTVLGSLPAVSAGEWLTATGWWIRDKEHGLQFKATVLKAVPPTTSEGVERYLAGGFVKGVGPVLAKKLVGHFGAEVLGVIEKNHADLESVDGIGPKRRERVANAWQEGMRFAKSCSSFITMKFARWWCGRSRQVTAAPITIEALGLLVACDESSAGGSRSRSLGRLAGCGLRTGVRSRG